MDSKNVLITIREASKILAVSEKTIRNWLACGMISRTKVFGAVRLYKDEIFELIKEGHKERVY